MRNSPTWFYNEYQQVGTDFENLAQVAAYDRNQSAASIKAEQALIAQLAIKPGCSVIDFGCGTGTFAIQAALAGAHVYAVDVSGVMLKYASQKAALAGAIDIEFHRAGFLTYQHATRPVDFIVTKFALHHLPDFWKMAALLRLFALLKKGGIFYLQDVAFSFPPGDYQTGIEAWIRRASKPQGGGWTADDFETHVREEYSTFSWILEGMLTRAGFEIEAANYPTPEYAAYRCRKPAYYQEN